MFAQDGPSSLAWAAWLVRASKRRVCASRSGGRPDRSSLLLLPLFKNKKCLPIKKACRGPYISIYGRAGVCVHPGFASLSQNFYITVTTTWKSRVEGRFPTADYHLRHFVPCVPRFAIFFLFYLWCNWINYIKNADSRLNSLSVQLNPDATPNYKIIHQLIICIKRLI